MKARTLSGQYCDHNTPGDGTGFSLIPTADAQTFMGKQTVERNADTPSPPPRERHEPVKP